jgi:hypothetical protein
MGRRFCSRTPRIHCLRIAVNDVRVDPIFRVSRGIYRSVKSLIVGFVISEKDLRDPFTVQPAIPVVIMLELQRGDPGSLLEG